MGSPFVGGPRPQPRHNAPPAGSDNPHAVSLRPPFATPRASLAHRALVTLALAGLPACSIFTSYPSSTADYRRAFEAGQFEDAGKGYLEEASGADELVYLLESATAYQQGGLLLESRAAFARAEKVVEGFESRPNISGRDAAEGVATAVLNDKAMPYDGEGFERVLLNSLQALNYWLLGDLSGALVEVRRAAERQRSYEAQIESRDPEDPPEFVFSQYLAATIREVAGDIDNAYVDYKQIQERAPGIRRVGSDLLRIAEATGRSQDADRWRREFEGAAASRSVGTDRSGSLAEIVVVHADGMAPQKSAIEIPIPTGRSVTKIAIPKYLPRSGFVTQLAVVVDGRTEGHSEELESIDSIAREHLDRRLAAIIARTTARAAARAVATEIGVNQLRKDKHQLAAVGVAIGAALWNILVEQADLRSWLTLPSRFAMARVAVPAGTHAVRIEARGAAGQVLATCDLGTIELAPGRAIPLLCRTVGSRLFVVRESPPPAAPSSGPSNTQPTSE